jgi:hypothetical protein
MVRSLRLLPFVLGAVALAAVPACSKASASPSAKAGVSPGAPAPVGPTALSDDGAPVPDEQEPQDEDPGMDGSGTVFAPPAGKKPQPWGIFAQGPTPPSPMPRRPPPRTSPEYGQVVRRVAAMAEDSGLASRVARRQLSVTNVTWEDTGRSVGSALGPNISDMTLQVRVREYGGPETHLMPVIRPPNFTDRTGDVPADRFFVRVGNQRGDALRTVPLTEVLQNLRAFSTAPSALPGNGNLLAPRDSHFLVSAQAVFLPVPQKGKAEFNPAVFNYQSAPGSPAVLTLLVTRQGTSIRVIENRSDDATGAGYGEELYFNDGGQRASLTAERRSDVVARIQAQGGPRTDDDRTALQQGADVIFLVQVPLVHAHRGVLGGYGGGGYPGAAPLDMAAESAAPPPAAAPMKSAGSVGGMARRERSNVEAAVIGHGEHVGPYREGHGTRLVRDTRFPIRITVQFYKATSNGVASDADLDAIARSLGSVYEHADFVGSLVLPEGDPRRPTAWSRVPREWFPW